MTEQEAYALASIARRLLRDGHISTVEANFIQALVSRQGPPTEYIPGAEDQGEGEQSKATVH